MFVATIFMNVISMSLAASFSFILILFARKFINKKVDISMKSLLWIIFIFVLLIPINFPSKLSVKNFIKPRSNTFEMSIEETITHEKDNVILTAGNKLKENIINLNDINTFYIVSLVWFITAMLLISKDTYFYNKVSNVESFEVPDFLGEIFEEQKRKLNVTSNVKVLIQDELKMPSLYGITNVFILIPKSVLELNKEELEMIIFHELLHYKKKHNLSFVLLKLLEDIHWFNPLIKYANSLIREDLECLIDLDVLNQNYDRNSYSKTILKVINCTNFETTNSLLPGMYSNKKTLERRILNMKKESGNIKHAIIIIAALITLISIFTISFASEKVPEQKLNNSSMSTDNKLSMVMPLDEIKVTATFGSRMHPITKEIKTHNGIDLKAEEGNNVYAIMDGVVIYTNYETERGNTIRIKHENGYVSTYAHGLEFLVNLGDKVNAGDPIMKAGATGRATGAHLHLELENEAGELVDINKMFE